MRRLHLVGAMGKWPPRRSRVGECVCARDAEAVVLCGGCGGAVVCGVF